MDLALFIVGIRIAAVLINSIALVLDAPLNQNLIFLFQQVIEILNDADRIFGFDGNAYPIVVDKAGRVNILILNFFIKHDRQCYIPFIIIAGFLQIVGCVPNLPGVAEITKYTPGGQLRQILVSVHGEGFRINQAFGICLIQLPDPPLLIFRACHQLGLVGLHIHDGAAVVGRACQVHGRILECIEAALLTGKGSETDGVLAVHLRVLFLILLDQIEIFVQCGDFRVIELFQYGALNIEPRLEIRF
ncbi:hypothetical protein D3C73_860740 [compost metagenome]